MKCFEYEVYKSPYSEIAFEYLYTIEHSITLSVYVRSDKFTGVHDFCIHDNQMSGYIVELKVMNKTLSGECTFRDDDSDGFMKFKFEGRVLRIDGQLGGSYNENYMRFGFNADQSVINRLIEVTENMIQI